MHYSLCCATECHRQTIMPKHIVIHTNTPKLQIIVADKKTSVSAVRQYDSPCNSTHHPPTSPLQRIQTQSPTIPLLLTLLPRIPKTPLPLRTRLPPRPAKLGLPRDTNPRNIACHATAIRLARVIHTDGLRFAFVRFVREAPAAGVLDALCWSGRACERQDGKVDGHECPLV